MKTPFLSEAMAAAADPSTVHCTDTLSAEQRLHAYFSAMDALQACFVDSLDEDESWMPARDTAAAACPPFIAAAKRTRRTPAPALHP